MLLSSIIRHLEATAPLQFQESYDNARLLTGSPGQEITAALFTLDITDEVMEEALAFGCNLIICHHPLIFKGIKRITGSNLVERCLILAIRHEIAIYAAHTNLDSITGGVNSRIAEKLGLQNCRILAPVRNHLLKLVTFVPIEHAENVRSALFAAGAGTIGNYDCCSFNIAGNGTFRGNEDSHPFIGNAGEIHSESEIRMETILPRHLTGKITKALLEAHPYEEVAYDLIPLDNEYPLAGAGMIGETARPVDAAEFLKMVKDVFGCGIIRHTSLPERPIQKIALCGGSGSFLTSKAIQAGAALFLTADIKYHDFFDAEKKIILADIGHYESEQFTKEVLKEIVLKKFPTFAVHLSKIKTNPVLYL